jgi:hypothetical protein
VIQGVGHYLYRLLGDKAVCEHWGVFRSTELGRFRNSRVRYRRCPLCGLENNISSGEHCINRLLLVEYETPAIAGHGFGGPTSGNEDSNLAPACEGGHGAAGPGGHFMGRCLCSVDGCAGVCVGFKNPLMESVRGGFPMPLGPNYALIPEASVADHQLGAGWAVGQRVFVRHLPSQQTTDEGNATDDKSQSPVGLLWQKGIIGGWATVKAWKTCGGRHGWHGDRTLCSAPWQTAEEEASVLLLSKDGSTGLDLSFATHLILLERIPDPALETQVISRLHRMGATGPAIVQIVSVAM